MKNVILSLGAGVLMTIAGMSAAAPQTNAGATGSGFDQFLRQFEEGIRRFVNGDASVQETARVPARRRHHHGRVGSL